MSALAALPALVAATLFLPPASQAAGYLCDFTQACIGRRPCFDSALQVEIRELEGENVALLIFADVPARLARIEKIGIWRSYITDDALDRVEVLDVDPEGRATLVASQPYAPPETTSRTGTCTSTGDIQ